MTERVTAWRRNYDELIAIANASAFRWGEHDCVMFAAKALDAQYELGVVAALRAHYDYFDEDTAIELINEYGSIETMVTALLGVEPLPPAHLSVGDVVLYDYFPIENFPHALAVHDGHQLLAPAATGLTYLRLDRAIKGWRP